MVCDATLQTDSGFLIRRVEKYKLYVMDFSRKPFLLVIGSTAEPARLAIC